jgi:hypothetical protein
MTTTLLPREHGAYGQLSLPLVTALSVAGLSIAGLLVAVSAIAAFVAHEPASVLLGLRGARIRQELGGTATRWLTWSLGISAIAGIVALLVMNRSALWSIVVPIVPAALLGVAAVRGREKSWYGEVAAALAFAGLAVPIAMAGGDSQVTANAVAIPFAVLFVTSTLSVRTVILRVRGGGDPKAMMATRRTVFLVTAVSTTCLVWLTASGVLPVATMAAAAPGLLTAVVIAARPPHPAHLRTIGWTLVAVSVLTAAIVIATV